MKMFIAPQSRPCAPSHMQVVHQARDLGEHDPDVLGADRHVDAEELLDRQAVGVLVAHHRDVVEPVHVGQRLDVGARLGELLGGAVQEADVRVGALDHLAVELEHEAQHAVRRRMLRPEVQGVVLDVGHGAACSMQAAVVVFADHARHDLARLDRHRLVDDALLLRVVAHLDRARDREVLAERMADEAVVGEDAAQVDVAVEDDAEQVEGLALEPVGGAPDLGERGNLRHVVVGTEDLQAQPPVVRQREQVRDDAEAKAFPGRVAVARVVDAAQVDQLLELQLGSVAQHAARPRGSRRRRRSASARRARGRAS